MGLNNRPVGRLWRATAGTMATGGIAVILALVIFGLIIGSVTGFGLRAIITVVVILITAAYVANSYDYFGKREVKVAMAVAAAAFFLWSIFYFEWPGKGSWAAASTPVDPQPVGWWQTENCSTNGLICPDGLIEPFDVNANSFSVRILSDSGWKGRMRGARVGPNRWEGEWGKMEVGGPASGHFWFEYDPDQRIFIGRWSMPHSNNPLDREGGKLTIQKS